MTHASPLVTSVRRRVTRLGNSLDQIVECLEGGLSIGPTYQCLVGALRHHGDDEAQLVRGISAKIDRLPKRDVLPRIPFRHGAPPRKTWAQRATDSPARLSRHRDDTVASVCHYG